MARNCALLLCAIAIVIVRRLVRALLVSGALLVHAAAAEAALQHPPQPHPDTAPPGGSVRVDGFPELSPSCPDVAMWLSQSHGISSPTDSSLTPLDGNVTIEKGLGQASAGPLVDVPVFTFQVPSVAPGPYVLYYSCPGSPNGWDSLFEGVPFTVLATVPGTDLPRTGADSDPIAVGLMAAGSTLILGAALMLWRRRGLA